MNGGILFVDDEENILHALSRELRPWFADRGLGWFQAGSGREALSLLEERHRDVLLVVSDLRMPGMAGDELVSQVHLRWPEIPAVLFSGHAEMQGLSRAVSAGIHGFVPKPWDTADLTAELDRALADRERALQATAERTLQAYQLERARDTQRTLFRFDALDPTRFRVHLTYEPRRGHFGGADFYEVVGLDPDRCVVLLGDVSGNGAEAALMTGVLHTLITQDEMFNLLSGSASPAYLLERLNHLVFANMGAEGARTVALTVLLFDHEQGTLLVSNAGGLPLIRLRGDVGTPLHLQGFPLGLVPDAKYQTLNLRTRAGDRWVLMTDGLVDRGSLGFLPGATVVDLLARDLGTEGHSDVVRSFAERFPDREFLDDFALLSVEVV